jgi:hypothetical protein
MMRSSASEAVHHHRCAAVLTTAMLAAVRYRASYAPPRRQLHRPPGTRDEKFIWQTHTANDTNRYDMDVREAHALLGTEPNDTLMRIKLNYLLRCRMFHPGVGGSAAMFYKITVAYERIMFDRGVEARHGRIAFTDTLGPRAKFDEKPLLPESRAALLLEEGVERTTDGQAVPWAKSGAEWRNAATPEDLLVINKEQNPEDMSAYAKDSWMSPKQNEFAAFGVERAATTIARREEKELENATSGDASNAVVPSHEPANEIDAAQHPDNGLVVINQPKRALYNQLPMKKWSNEDLMVRWSTAADRLTHDEEEAVAREIIERSINETGGQLTVEQKEFMMNHLVERSDSVAGEAARSATDVMYYTNERKRATMEGLVLFTMVGTFLFGCITLWLQYKQHLHDISQNPHSRDHVSADTMLPWWGNDVEYERQVKRIFIEEWRRARMTARRVQTFQDGVSRESMPLSARESLETAIFDVTAERLQELRARVAKNKDGKVTVSEPIFEA